jgi:WD40 repeat protein
VQISKDGKYFVFSSGYKEKYAEKKKLPRWTDDRIYFFSAQTKKELWNVKSPEGVPLISPDGLSVIVYRESGGFDIFNFEGKKIFEYRHKIWAGTSLVFSPDSNYFAVVGSYNQPLILFKRDGTKLWEKGHHNIIASISEGASYISTYPYFLGPSYVADPQNSHKGILYDKNGNKILEGLGVVSGDGTKIAMYSSDKITIISLPDKVILKEIPIQINLPDIDNPLFAVFSYDGRYLVFKSEDSILIFDLVDDIRKEITISGLGKFPKILLTKDGKYLVVHPRDWQPRKSIYYYQLY